jgi:hypothetical protein
MSEPTPPIDPATPSTPEMSPAAKAARRACNWHRVRVYSYGIILMLTMWFCATLLTIRLHPERIVHALLAKLPFSSSTGDIYWLNRRTLVINDFKFGGFFYADQLVVTASPFGLWRHHIAKVQVYGGQLFTGPLYDALAKNTSSSSGDGLDWVIGQLELSRGTVMLDNIISNVSIPVRVGVRHPIVLNYLRLGKPDASAQMNAERTVEIGAVSITSPMDPLAPVFFFPLTKVTFTYQELWHHKFRSIEMVRPTIYLGEDLFWLTQELRSEPTPAADAQGIKAPWFIGRFGVSFGRLAINAFGQPVAHLPFFFNTAVDNIRFDQLDEISAKSSINIADLTQDYPDYKVKIKNLTGQIYFSWPPTNANANNVVNTIHIKEVAWNDIPAKDVSMTVTFDQDGVYGKLNDGTCEGGLLNGNFEFYYTDGFKWNADFFATKVNCQPIADKLAGKYCSLTGELDGKIAVQGQSTRILNCTGSLALPHPGELEIKSMAELLKRLPPDMIQIKKEALELAINAFKTYPYDKGLLTIDYKPQGGLSALHLDGPVGAREFQVYLHPFPGADLPGTSAQ